LHRLFTSTPNFLIGIGFFLTCLPLNSYGQKIEDYDSLLADYLALDSLLLDEIENDSSSLFDILEDIINENYLKSQLSIRLGYNSEITNAGRNFGVNQFGLNSGISFYHKSGIFADVSGYYNSDQNPNYNTTITSIGYMGILGSKWSYFLTYDHFFYREPENVDYIVNYPLTNSLSSSTNFNFSNFNIALDYSFLFGESSAHRVRFNLGYNFAIKKLGFIDRIGINPNLSALAGNANVTSIVFSREIAETNSQALIDQIGRARFVFLYRNNRPLLRELLSNEETVNTFGIMNYSVLVPISFQIKKSTLLLNYTLNFPVALSGEQDFDTSVNSFFSATYLFTFSF